MSARELEHVASAGGTGFERFNRMREIIDWACERGEMKDAIDRAVYLERPADIRLQKFEAGAAEQMPDVRDVASDQIVDCNDRVAPLSEPVA